MPLPEQLKKGASKAKKKAVVAATMYDLKHGPHHKDRTHKQEVAIAMKQAGESKMKSDNSLKKRRGPKGKNGNTPSPSIGGFNPLGEMPTHGKKEKIGKKKVAAKSGSETAPKGGKGKSKGKMSPDLKMGAVKSGIKKVATKKMGKKK